MKIKLQQRDKDIIAMGIFACLSMIITRAAFLGGGWW